MHKGRRAASAKALETKPGVLGGTCVLPQKGSARRLPRRSGERHAGASSHEPKLSVGMDPARRCRFCDQENVRGRLVLIVAPPARKTGARGRYPRRCEAPCKSTGKPSYLPSQGMPSKPRRPKRAMRIAPLPIAGLRQRELRWTPRGTPHPTMMRWSGKCAQKPYHREFAVDRND